MLSGQPVIDKFRNARLFPPTSAAAVGTARTGGGLSWRIAAQALGKSHSPSLAGRRLGLSLDPEPRKHFEREAKAVSSLNHPNICTLHDIGSQDKVDLLVKEYLEGETLAIVPAGPGAWRNRINRKI